jgi:hypothetical protein
LLISEVAGVSPGKLRKREIARLEPGVSPRPTGTIQPSAWFCRPGATQRADLQEIAMTRFVRTFVSASLLGLVALPVFAQTGDQGPFRLAPDETEIRASDFIGRAIYAT